MGRGLSSPPARLALALWRLQHRTLSTVSSGSGPHRCLGSYAAVKTFMGSPAMFMGHSGIWRWNGDSSVARAWLTRDAVCLPSVSKRAFWSEDVIWLLRQLEKMGVWSVLLRGRSEGPGSAAADCAAPGTAAGLRGETRCGAEAELYWCG